MSIKKLVCLGDSLTEGYEIDLSKRWTEQLKSNVDFPIINSGISGDTTAGMLARFNKDVLDHNPTHLIFMGGTNDLYHDLSDKQILSNVYAVYKQAKFHRISIAIGLPTPVFPNDQVYPESIFLTENVLKGRVEKFRQLLVSFANEKELPIVDFGQNLEKQHVLDDGVHPNEEGQSIMAEQVLNLLSKWS